MSPRHRHLRAHAWSRAQRVDLKTSCRDAGKVGERTGLNEKGAGSIDRTRRTRRRRRQDREDQRDDCYGGHIIFIWPCKNPLGAWDSMEAFALGGGKRERGSRPSCWLVSVYCHAAISDRNVGKSLLNNQHSAKTTLMRLWLRERVKRRSVQLVASSHQVGQLAKC